MKNIHIIPTDKPSKLYLGDNGNFVFGLIQGSIKSKNNNYTNQNIYITSDEEIKEGDWIYSFVDNKIYKIVYSKNNIIQSFYHSHYFNESKKIILTTDLELQKDGIQATDDEFLEWFVKNPSCEEVEINKLCYGALSGFVDAGYKVIIPKEEPKQETLEEAAERLYDDNLFGYEKYRDGFINGAKWQAERSYSEEEVHKIVESYQNNVENNPLHITYDNWFEQFKKK